MRTDRWNVRLVQAGSCGFSEQILFIGCRGGPAEEGGATSTFQDFVRTLSAATLSAVVRQQLPWQGSPTPATRATRSGRSCPVPAADDRGGPAASALAARGSSTACAGSSAPARPGATCTTTCRRGTSTTRRANAGWPAACSRRSSTTWGNCYGCPCPATQAGAIAASSYCRAVNA